MCLILNLLTPFSFELFPYQSIFILHCWILFIFIGDVTDAERQEEFLCIMLACESISRANRVTARREKRKIGIFKQSLYSYLLSFSFSFSFISMSRFFSFFWILSKSSLKTSSWKEFLFFRFLFFFSLLIWFPSFSWEKFSLFFINISWNISLSIFWRKLADNAAASIKSQEMLSGIWIFLISVNEYLFFFLLRILFFITILLLELSIIILLSISLILSLMRLLSLILSLLLIILSSSSTILLS